MFQSRCNKGLALNACMLLTMGLKGRAAMCGTASTSHWQYHVDVRHITVQPPNAFRPVKLSASGAHRQHHKSATDPGGASLQALEQHRAGPKAFECPSSPESSRARQAAPDKPLGLPPSGPQHPHSQVRSVIPLSRELIIACLAPLFSENQA